METVPSDQSEELSKLAFGSNHMLALMAEIARYGLTTPLTCTVPVTPGEPVTVTIAVADTSDRIYDNAVALLDGEIWSD